MAGPWEQYSQPAQPDGPWSKYAAPASVKAGAGLMEIPRQIGLTARYGLEGLGQMAEIVTEPMRVGMEAIGVPRMKPTGRAATAFADTIGLPSPQTPDERTVGAATRLVAGAGGMAGAAGAAARNTGGAAQAVFKQLAAAPGAQAVGAGAAGRTGGAPARQAGAARHRFGGDT